MKRSKSKKPKETHLPGFGILKGGGLMKALLKSRREDQAHEERKLKRRLTKIK